MRLYEKSLCDLLDRICCRHIYRLQCAGREYQHDYRLDKPAMIKLIAGHKCDIKSFSFADEKLTNVGAATAIITMKVAPDGACEGQTLTPFISGSLVK